MKIGDVVKCRATQRIGLIVGIVNWYYQILFSEGIEAAHCGYLEVIHESRRFSKS